MPTVALALVVVGVLFAPIIFQGRVLAFRDAVHFHGPLYRLIAERWAEGDVPLWNPYENLGQPLAGHPAAAVFYPGKLAWLLPIDHQTAYHGYILAHLLLAAVGAYGAARTGGAGRSAATLAGLAYALSGTVLMQVFNVPFLVGAAWLPWAVVCIERVFAGGASHEVRPWRWAGLLGVVLALMVLGGDPQMAYMAGLMAGGRWLMELPPRGLWRAWRAKWSFHAEACPPGSPIHPGVYTPGSPGWFVRGGAALLLAAVMALGLSAVQVLPSAELAARSDRTPPGWGELLAGRPDAHSHHEHIYHFSVAPWRWAELLWPNVAGRQYPVHRRWLEVIPAEGRLWTPTLYLGVVPLVLAFSAMRLIPRRQRPDATRHVWLTWTAILAMVAALGFYGIGWLIGEIVAAAGGDAGELPVGGPFGGLYWLMTVGLPGFARFRYPAKLWVIASLGLSLLAARGFDRAMNDSSRRASCTMAVVAAVSFVGLIVAGSIRPWWDGWMADVPPDMLFGPLDRDGAWWDMAGAMAQTTLVAAVAWWLLRWRPRFAGGMLVALVAVDLMLANGWMVVTAPRDAVESPLRFGTTIVAAGRQSTSSRAAPAPPRVWRSPLWYPPTWQRTRSPDRLTEWIRWDRATLWPKYHLDDRVAVVEVHGTMMVESWAQWLRRNNPLSLRGTAGAKAPESPGRNGASITPRGPLARWAVAPRARRPRGAWSEMADWPDAGLSRHDRPAARCWVEPDGTCRIARYEPERIEVDVTLDRPGRLVLAEQHYPGWSAWLDSAAGRRMLDVRAERGVFRAVDLPAGEHRVVFRYRPRSVLIGAIISAVAWLGAIGAMVVLAARRRA